MWDVLWKTKKIENESNPIEMFNENNIFIYNEIKRI